MTAGLANPGAAFWNISQDFAQHMCRREHSWHVAEATAAPPEFLQFQATYSFHGLLLSHFGNLHHFTPPALKMQNLEAK
eukprot:s675_g27.t2